MRSRAAAVLVLRVAIALGASPYYGALPLAVPVKARLQRREILHFAFLSPPSVAVGSLATRTSSLLMPVKPTACHRPSYRAACFALGRNDSFFPPQKHSEIWRGC